MMKPILMMLPSLVLLALGLVLLERSQRRRLPNVWRRGWRLPAAAIQEELSRDSSDAFCSGRASVCLAVWG